MAEPPNRKLAVILHADVAGSTVLVQRDEGQAHERITRAFQRLSQTIREYGGQVREVRGDALVAEFGRASDAVCAAIAFQHRNAEHITTLEDDIVPEVRIGISLGEVVIADGTVTGAGVVLAQRIEQLAEPGGVRVTEAIREATPTRLPLNIENLGEQKLKGFEQPVHVHVVNLRPGADIPPPDPQKAPRSRRIGIVATVVIAIAMLAAALGWLEPWQPRTEAASLDRMAHALPSVPSIAVLPFKNLSGDPKQDYLAGGVTEEIIFRLSRAPDLFVIAGRSTEIYKDKAASIKQVAEEQGVRYVLEGSIKTADEKVRVNADLVDALEGTYVWTERYDRKKEDLFALLDDITYNIALAMQVKLTRGDMLRRRAEGLDPEAFRLAWKAARLMDDVTRENLAKARELLTQAQGISPKGLFPLVMLGWVDALEAVFGYSPSRETSLQNAESIARQVLERDETYPDALMLVGRVFTARRQPDKAIPWFEKAVEANPNHADALAMLGGALTRAGKPEAAIPAFEKAKRLSPYYPGWFDLVAGYAYMMAGQYDAAIKAYEAQLAKNEFVLWGQVRLAATYALKGDLERAREQADKVLEVNPKFSIEWYSKTFLSTYQKSDVERELDALRLAGLPEKPHQESAR